MRETKPALTPEEWARNVTHDGAAGLLDGRMWVAERCDAENPHALAALALHGQTFGFTWEDVEGMRALATWLHNHATGEGPWFFGSRNLCDLAGRVAALLPPREEGE